MEEIFREIDPEEIVNNTFKLIGKDFMLVTAGDNTSFNTMTASWGGFGVLWGKKVSFIVIRPTRYTYQFIEKSGSYSLSFFGEQYKEVLMTCGTKSGRDVDKVAEMGLTPIFSEGPIYFKEARLVLQCKSIYYQDMIPGNFLTPEIEGFYSEKDYHRWYVGEIMQCLTR